MTQSATNVAPPTPLATIGDPAERAVVAAMRDRCPCADPTRVLPEVPPSALPRHVAVIMDGNGRWARRRGLDRSAGHRAGAQAVHGVLDAAADLGIEYVTLYSFSIENWKRPPDEVQTLMGLFVEMLAANMHLLLDNDIRVQVIGRREGLPAATSDALDRAVAATARCRAATLVLAVNYGARTEITDAVRAIAQRVRDGQLAPEAITETTIASHLYTAGIPDPDLLVRTGGEMRVSNYLLWQISYAELHVTDIPWPSFGRTEFVEAVRAYARRNRRFGGVDDSNA